MDEREDLSVGVDCGVDVWLSTGDKDGNKPVLANSVNGRRSWRRSNAGLPWRWYLLTLP
jgi:hypothetical protein